MKKLTLIFLLCFPLVAQVTVTKPLATVTATTGSTVCTATPQAAPPSNIVTAKCVNGTDIFSSPIPVPVGTASGFTYQFNSAGGAITWLFTMPTATGPIAYQVTATPTAGCPTGAICNASGTF